MRGAPRPKAKQYNDLAIRVLLLARQPGNHRRELSLEHRHPFALRGDIRPQRRQLLLQHSGLLLGARELGLCERRAFAASLTASMVDRE